MSDKAEPAECREFATATIALMEVVSSMVEEAIIPSLSEQLRTRPASRHPKLTPAPLLSRRGLLRRLLWKNCDNL